MSERNKRAERAIWRQYKGRITGLLLAFIFALLWVVFNFGTALLVFIIAAVGYIVGAYFDGEVDLRAWLRFFMK